MKDSEKVWLLYTVNVAGIKNEQSKLEILNRVRYYYSSKDDSVKEVFMLSETEPNSVKLIYDPKGCMNGNNDESLKAVNDYLSKIMTENLSNVINREDNLIKVAIPTENEIKQAEQFNIDLESELVRTFAKELHSRLHPEDVKND